MNLTHESLHRMGSPSARGEGEEGACEEDEDDPTGKQARLMTEADMARRECKARSVLNKWKETENRALNGGGPEDDAAGESVN